MYTLLHTLAIARMCNKSWACHCEWEGFVGVCRVGQSSPQLMGLINKGEFKPPGWKVQVRLASRVCIMQGFPWSCFLPQKVFRGRWPLQGQREGRDEGWHNTHFIPTGGASWCAGVGLCAFRAPASPSKLSRCALSPLLLALAAGPRPPPGAGRGRVPCLGTKSVPHPDARLSRSRGCGEGGRSWQPVPAPSALPFTILGPRLPYPPRHLRHLFTRPPCWRSLAPPLHLRVPGTSPSSRTPTPHPLSETPGHPHLGPGSRLVSGAHQRGWAPGGRRGLASVASLAPAPPRHQLLPVRGARRAPTPRRVPRTGLLGDPGSLSFPGLSFPTGAAPPGTRWEPVRAAQPPPRGQPIGRRRPGVCPAGGCGGWPGAEPRPGGRGRRPGAGGQGRGGASGPATRASCPRCRPGLGPRGGACRGGRGWHGRGEAVPGMGRGRGGPTARGEGGGGGGGS